MTLPKEYSKPSVTSPKGMQMPELLNKEFERTALKMLRELQENTDKHCNDIRKAI